MADRPTHLAVGQVSRAHGTRGEVVIRFLTDHPEDVFVPGVVLRASSYAEDGPDPDVPPLRVETVRPFRGGYLVRFNGVGDRDQADRLRSRLLILPVEELAELEEGEVFLHDLIGVTVRTVAGVELGVIDEVYDVQPAYLLEIRGSGRTFLIPMTEHIVREVDMEARVMVVDPPEGLLDL